MADGDGLYLFVAPKSAKSPKGVKSWRYDYRIGGRRETLTIGKYPDVSLAEAREKHGDARKLVAKGESPAQTKHARIERGKLAQNTVKAVAGRWYDSKAGARSASWKDNNTRWLERDILGRHPALGPIRAGRWLRLSNGQTERLGRKSMLIKV